MKRLPDKMSDLIRLSLIDEAKAQRSPRYIMDMNNWHQPELDSYDNPVEDPDYCNVCLAGAVIAFSLGGEWGKSLEPEDFRNGNVMKLHALDKLRQGYLYAAAECMRMIGKIRKSETFTRLEFDNDSYDMPVYDDNRLAWRHSMFGLANRLAKAGL